MTGMFFELGDGTCEPEFLQRLLDNDVIRRVDMHTCYDCGLRSPDQGAFVWINAEPDTGYPGDLACKECAVGHTATYRSRP